MSHGLSTSTPPISCCCSSSSKNISSSSRSSSLDSNHTWPATGLLSSFIFLYIFSLFLNGVLYDRRAGGSFSGRSFLFCLFFFSPSLCYFFFSSFTRLHPSIIFSVVYSLTLKSLTIAATTFFYTDRLIF